MGRHSPVFRVLSNLGKFKDVVSEDLRGRRVCVCVCVCVNVSSKENVHLCCVFRSPFNAATRGLCKWNGCVFSLEAWLFVCLFVLWKITEQSCAESTITWRNKKCNISVLSGGVVLASISCWRTICTYFNLWVWYVLKCAVSVSVNETL